MKGIEPEARDAAKDAARRAGMTLGQWLNHVILDQDGEYADEHAAAPASRGGRGGADMEALAARLDAVNERLDLMAGGRERAQRQRFAERPGPERQAYERPGFDRSDYGRNERGDDRRAGMARHFTHDAQSEPAPRDDAAMAALERALFEVVDHIELTDKRNGEVLKTIQARLSELATRVHEEGAAGQSATHEAILGLESRIGDLARRIETRDEQHVETHHAALEHKLSELANRVDTASDRARSNPAIEAIEARLNQVTSKLNIAERLMTPQTDFNQVKSEVGKLREEVARTREPTKPALVHAIENRLNSLSTELSSVRSSAASNSAVVKLGERLDSIAARLGDDRSSGDDANAGRLDAVEDRLAEIAHRLEAAVDRDEPHPQIGALEQQVAELARRVESGSAGGHSDAELNALHGRMAELAARIDSSGAGAGSGGELPAAFHDLDARVNEIAARLGSAERHFSVLESIESNLSDLFSTMEASRQGAVDAAEQAAFNAAQRFMAQGSGDVAAGDALAALERGLAEVKTQTTAADRHNQETLEAIHDTLKRVIERLGKLEAQPPAGPPVPGIETSLASEERAAPAFGSMADESDEEGFDDFRLPPLTDAPAAEMPVVDRKADEAPQTDAADEAPAEAEDEPRGESDTTEFSRAYDAPSTSGQNDDFIAAARRAALAANQAQEIQESGRGAGGKDGDATKGPDGRSRGRRRTLLFVAAALLVAAGALTMSGTISIDLGIGEREASLSDGAESETASDLLDGARQEIIAPANQAANLFNQSGPESREPIAPAARALVPGAAEFIVPDPAAGSAITAAETSITAAPSPAATPGESLMTPSPVAPPRVAATDRQAATGEPAPTETAPAAATSVIGASGVAAVEPIDAHQLAALATAPGPGSMLLPSPVPLTQDGPSQDGPPTLMQLAESGNAEAQFEVAARFADGRAGNKDFAMAAQWYQRAAAQGLAPAQYRLGALYEKGQGVSQDKSAARIWYQRAAEQGNLKAMHNLAVLLAGGVTGGADYARAARWFLRAAELGLADSQYNLAVLHERGLGVERDLGAAYKWFSIAAAKGDKDAEERMNALGAELDAATLARARAAYQSWTAAPLDREANFVELPANLAPDGPASAAGPDPIVAQVQSLLADLGYDPGPADGLMGPRTRDAIVSFQRERGLPETGTATSSVVKNLRAALEG